MNNDRENLYLYSSFLRIEAVEPLPPLFLKEECKTILKKENLLWQEIMEMIELPILQLDFLIKRKSR
jgi:hypothetical protein